jgi:spore cortex formation protein SpoVR/YcgB (stage V sporulation)
MSTLIKNDRLLFDTADWDFSTIQRINDAVEEIAVNELGLNVYPNQIEVISTEQMLDAYSSIGMPLFYKHWSFGKQFARNEALYRAGMQGLAYEIVINSNPVISYIMEENTATMQTLVIAHAAFGHNHFFKNNYVFKQWTDADGILDYLEFARDYVMKCEEQYGASEVERLLDAAHALMSHGVHKYPRRRATDLRTEEKRERERREHDERVFNDLWRTVPGNDGGRHDPTALERRRARAAAREYFVFPGEVRAPVAGMAARAVAHCADHRAIFLPADSDQGDERGLRDIRALPDHEPAA